MASRTYCAIPDGNRNQSNETRELNAKKEYIEQQVRLKTSATRRRRWSPRPWWKLIKIKKNPSMRIPMHPVRVPNPLLWILIPRPLTSTDVLQSAARPTIRNRKWRALDRSSRRLRLATRRGSCGKIPLKRRMRTVLLPSRKAGPSRIAACL